MLASIHPLGERARGNRWWLTATAYMVGSLAGGALLGAVMGYLGQLVGMVAAASPSVVGFFVVAVCAMGLLLDLPLGVARLPTLRRQVDENWLGRYRGWVYGMGFGFQLGVGLVTTVTTATVYVAFAIAALSQSALAGLVIGTTFGLARAVPVVLVRRVTEAQSLHGFHRRFQAAAPVAHRFVIAIEAAALSVGAGAALAG